MSRRLVALSQTGLVSGAELILQRLLTWARETGWETTCLTPAGPLAQRLQAEEFDTVAIPELKLPALPRLAGAAVVATRSLVAAHRLRAVARDAELVVVSGVLALPALLVASLRVPRVWLGQDVLSRRDAQAVVQRCRSAVDATLAVSEAAAEPLRRAGLKVTVIRHGTPWPMEPARPALGPPLIVGCTGLLTPGKGQLELLDAVARLGRNDVRVELVGGYFPRDEPYVHSLTRRARRTDLRGRVQFVGRVENPMERMRAWTVAVVPSTEPEAGPLTLLEAMSLGLPVVATTAGAPPEYLADAGLLVPPGDIDGLSAAIDHVLGDATLRRHCATAGRAIVAERYTLAHQRDRMMQFLEQAAERKRPREWFRAGAR